MRIHACTLKLLLAEACRNSTCKPSSSTSNWEQIGSLLQNYAERSSLVRGMAQTDSSKDQPVRFVTPAISSQSYKLAAKGHRNLFIRGTTTLMNAIVTAVLICYDIDIMHQPFLMVCQLVGSASLYIQWRTGRPSMFVLRGCSSFAQAIVTSHTLICGRRWYFWDECVEEAWTDVRTPLRVLTALAFIRLICNGISLCCQFRYPHRMFRGRGNEQLFYRGCIQTTGVPINLLRGILKLALLPGTKFERLPAEIIANLVRALVIIPIASSSLFNQWWLTKKGATGHARSDAFERLMDPAIDCPLERLKVTIVSASGLRNADLGGLSDPYCVCEVPGRPESTWQTKHIDNTLDPEWNESCELKVYRLHDPLKFSIRDHDKDYMCCKNGDDPLGDVTLKSHLFHPDGFDGVLAVEGAGKGKKAPTLRVRVDILDAGDQPIVLGIAGDREESLMLAAEDTDKPSHNVLVGEIQFESIGQSLDEKNRVASVIGAQLVDTALQQDERSRFLALDPLSREGLAVPNLAIMQPSASLNPSRYFNFKPL